MLIMMKVILEDGRQTGVREGQLILWAPLVPLHHPGYQKSTAEERQDKDNTEQINKTAERLSLKRLSWCIF